MHPVIEAERTLIASALLAAMDPNNPDLSEALALVEPGDFRGGVNRAAWARMRELYQSNTPIDAVSVASATDWRISELMTLTDETPTAANILHHAREVRDTGHRRRIAVMAKSLAADVADPSIPSDEAIAKAAQVLAEVADKREGSTSATGKELAREEFRALEERRQNGGRVGISTGFDKLDSEIGGLCPAMLYNIAARPGMGKTAWAMDILRNVLRDGKAGFFQSLEMSRSQLAQRIICAEGLVDLKSFRASTLGPNDYPGVTRGTGFLSDARLVIDDEPGINLLKLETKARRAQMALGGLDVVVVDYLQLLDGQHKDRRVAVDNVSRGLKNLSKSMHVPVIALCQLNRGVEEREDKRPRLSDLRESGGIEQDADVVIGLYRPGYYAQDGENTEAEAVILKNRHGKQGVIPLKWIARSATYRDA